MRRTWMLMVMAVLSLPSFAQDRSDWLARLPKQKDYVQKRASSYDRSGGNFDLRRLPAGETLTLLDDSGPGMITHIWITLTNDNPDNLKALVLRMYWDGETTPASRLRWEISSAWGSVNIFSIARFLWPSDPTGH